MKDWVKERSQCSAGAVFERLKIEIENDVQVRNSLIPKGHDYKFHFEVTDSRKDLIVSLHGKIFDKTTPRDINEGISVHIDGSAIIVRENDLKEKLRATLTLNENGECRLKIDGVEYESWRFRQAALEELFFDVV
jgi:RNase P/RNase MRP subunit p29